MSMSRRLNADSVRRHGGNCGREGAFGAAGLGGKVLASGTMLVDCEHPTETRNGIVMYFSTPKSHYGSPQRVPWWPDPYSSAVYFDDSSSSRPSTVTSRQTRGGRTAQRIRFDRADVPVTTPKGWLLRRGWRQSLGNDNPARKRKASSGIHLTLQLTHTRRRQGCGTFGRCAKPSHTRKATLRADQRVDARGRRAKGAPRAGSSPGGLW